MSWVDIAVLGFFVSSSLVGIYSAAWNIAIFLIIFGNSISQTIFPEISRRDNDEDERVVSDLIEVALAYSGLILIPGFVGSLLLGERILRIYGDDFTTGAVVLTVLVFAVMIESYQSQLTTTLNAVNKPDKAFRVNAMFILSNVVLNVVLISVFGLLGAAVATTLSLAGSAIFAYYMLSSILSFKIPLEEIGRQWIAAGVMGVTVYFCLYVENTIIHLGHNVLIVIASVSIGAVVYFTTLLGISHRFRTTVLENIPVNTFN